MREVGCVGEGGAEEGELCVPVGVKNNGEPFANGCPVRGVPEIGRKIHANQIEAKARDAQTIKRFPVAGTGEKAARLAKVPLPDQVAEPEAKPGEQSGHGH